MRRLNSLAVQAFAVAFALSPLTAEIAAAQAPMSGPVDRPLAEYDPLGVRAGAFHLFPAIEFEVGHNDNVYADEANERSDTVTTVRAALPVRMNRSRHALNADFGLQRTFHQDFDANDTTTGFAGIDGRLDLAGDAELTAGLRYAREAEPRFDPDSPLGAIEPIEYDATRLSFGAARRFNRLRVSGGLARTTYDYDDGVSALGPIEQDDRDRDETEAMLRGEWEISPGISVFGQGSVNQREYDMRPPQAPISRDSDGASFLAGAAFDVTNLIRGQVGIGYFTQDYDDPASGEVSGLAVSTRLQYFATQLTTVNISLDRNVEEATYFNAASYVSLRGGLDVQHELRRNIMLSAGVWAGTREFTALDRDDDVLTLQAGASYRLNRRVAVQALYRRDSQDSSGLNRDRDFDINAVSLRLRLAL